MLFIKYFSEREYINNNNDLEAATLPLDLKLRAELWWSEFKLKTEKFYQSTNRISKRYIELLKHWHSANRNALMVRDVVILRTEYI